MLMEGTGELIGGQLGECSVARSDSPILFLEYIYDSIVPQCILNAFPRLRNTVKGNKESTQHLIHLVMKATSWTAFKLVLLCSKL